MNINELMKLLKESFEAEGFNRDYIPEIYKKNNNDTSYRVSLSKDNKATYTKNPRYDFYELNGYILSIYVVNRHNGTDADISADVIIYNVSNSFGRKVDHKDSKIRFNINMSEKSINNRIAKILKAWDEITN